MGRENWFIQKVKAQIAQTKRYMLGKSYSWLLNPINQRKGM